MRRSDCTRLTVDDVDMNLNVTAVLGKERPAPEIAAELGVNDQTFPSWVFAARVDDGEVEALSLDVPHPGRIDRGYYDWRRTDAQRRHRGRDPLKVLPHHQARRQGPTRSRSDEQRLHRPRTGSPLGR